MSSAEREHDNRPGTIGTGALIKDSPPDHPSACQGLRGGPVLHMRLFVRGPALHPPERV